MESSFAATYDHQTEFWPMGWEWACLHLPNLAPTILPYMTLALLPCLPEGGSKRRLQDLKGLWNHKVTDLGHRIPSL